MSDAQRRANSIAALQAITSPIMETLAGLAIASVILVSGYLIVQGGQTPGSIDGLHHGAAACLRAGKAAGKVARLAGRAAWSASG